MSRSSGEFQQGGQLSHVRIHDVRAQRKPVFSRKFGSGAIKAVSVSPDEKFFYLKKSEKILFSSSKVSNL